MTAPRTGFIEEKSDVWQFLSGCSRPLALYGTGDGADKIMAVLTAYGLSPAAVFVSDERLRSKYFAGHQLIPISSLSEEKEYVLLLAFGTEEPELIARLQQLAGRQLLLAPDVPIAGEVLFTADFVREHAGELRQAYDIWADEDSRRVFAALCNFKLSGKLNYLSDAWSFGASPPWLLSREESFLDVGAYRGDSVAEFLAATGGDFKRIWAWEPQPAAFRHLAAFLRTLPEEKASAWQLAAWDKPAVLFLSNERGRGSRVGCRPTGRFVAAQKIDDMLGGSSVTYMKLDVEGAEARVLAGAAGLLAACSPKLKIAAYHRGDDLFTLPLLLKKLNPGYRLYLRQSPAIPAWEVYIYAV